jgi:hypothetical protein
MYRTLKTIPVLAKAGAILVLEREEDLSFGADNPKGIELCIFAGNDGEFNLYEDDGISMEYEKGSYVQTKYILDWNKEKAFSIYPAKGDLSLIPDVRSYCIKIYGLPENSIESVSVNEEITGYTEHYDEKRNIQIIKLMAVKSTDKVEIKLKGTSVIKENRIPWRVFEILNRAQIEFLIKEKIYDIVLRSDSIESMIFNLNSIEVSDDLKEMIYEIVLTYQEKSNIQ